MQEFRKIGLTKKEILNIKKEVKLTNIQIMRVFEILKLSFIRDTDEDILRKLRDDIKKRLYELNREEFLPFKNKKIPYIEIDGNF